MTELFEVQRMMEQTYGARDRSRGLPATVAWLAEEMGELAKTVRKGTREEQVHELGDTLAWLASLANQLAIPLDEAFGRYLNGCPRLSLNALRVRRLAEDLRHRLARLLGADPVRPHHLVVLVLDDVAVPHVLARVREVALTRVTSPG